ncbi:hypothetical protein E3O19_06805 [Cryobacterium algoritolerans]|uniref:Uncharacterized protein n=1 Tax=Cryobacterium algoritolerans TaxID=1259184 RepID=A0A4V3IF74_9MICO|nr:hypothetical protein [Cryobacterium algoritolerans]TFC16832.1 hypothetical protein E3O19_06805 [Cryobacterium algoritolerans]
MPSFTPEDEEGLSRAISDAVTGVLNEHGARAGLQPLRWSLTTELETDFYGTHPGGREHPDAQALCASWADHLGLAEWGAGYPDEASRLWAARLGNWRLSVSVFTDPELYRSVYPDEPDEGGW